MSAAVGRGFRLVPYLCPCKDILVVRCCERSKFEFDNVVGMGRYCNRGVLC